METINLYASIKELEKVKEAIEYGELPYVGTYLYKLEDETYEFSSFGEKAHEIVNFYPKQLDKIIKDNKDSNSNSNSKIKIKLKKGKEYWELQ